MQLFYSAEIAAGGYCTLDAEESRHAMRVMRLRVGDRLSVTDGRGVIYDCVVEGGDERGCVVTAKGCRQVGGRNGLTLAVAPTKNPSRMEWMVEKAVEVGVREIVLLRCDHSERDSMRVERLRRVALSAMKQSLHATLPEIGEVRDYDEWMEAQREMEATRLVAHCDDERMRCPIATVIEKGRDAIVMIGPEGDFSDREIDVALAEGYKPVSLGSSRLRTETAAIYAAVAYGIVNDKTEAR